MSPFSSRSSTSATGCSRCGRRSSGFSLSLLLCCCGGGVFRLVLLPSPDRFGFVPQFLAWLSRNVGAENPLFFSSFLAIQRAIEEALVRRFAYVRVEIGVPGWGDGSGRTGKGGEKRRLVVFWFGQGIFLSGRKNVAEDAFQFGCVSQEEFFCGERVVLFFSPQSFVPPESSFGHPWRFRRRLETRRRWRSCAHSRYTIACNSNNSSWRLDQ